MVDRKKMKEAVKKATPAQRKKMIKILKDREINRQNKKQKSRGKGFTYA